MSRIALLAVPLAVLMAMPALAQTLRSAVVPADAAVVIPPRGQPVPVTAPSGPAAPQPAALPPLPAQAAAGPNALVLVPAMMLPLAAGMLLGGGLPGSGGSAAPATTTR